MALVTSLPGPLSVAFRRGDEFSTLLDFSFATTGYTFAAAIYSVVTGATVATPTLTVVSHATGQINLSLSELQTASLAAGPFRAADRVPSGRNLRAPRRVGRPG